MQGEGLPLLATQGRCTPCLEKARLSQRRHRGLPIDDAFSLMPTQPLLAHCGMWHVVTQIPFPAPCYGMMFFQEA